MGWLCWGKKKVYFTTDLLSRHARILSKLQRRIGLQDTEGRPIAFYTRLPHQTFPLLSCTVTQSCGSRNSDSFSRSSSLYSSFFERYDLLF